MPAFNVAFPILPGKVDAARSFANETLGERRSAFEEFQKRADVARETWSIQELPEGGSLMLVYFEAANPAKTFAELAQDPSDFAVWFRERVQEINGIDLKQPPEGHSDVALDWTA
ncbi:MAG: hypothetical protein ACR2NA_09795 [Solirubrobacterales bacterium]